MDDARRGSHVGVPTLGDRVRRAVSLAAAVTVSLALPAVAWGAFESQDTVEVEVSLGRMATPSGVAGTYKCRNAGGKLEALEVDIDGFADSGPAGAAYAYRIGRAGEDVLTRTDASRTVALETPKVEDDKAPTAWTLSITSVLGSWTGTPWTRTIECPEKSSQGGTL